MKTIRTLRHSNAGARCFVMECSGRVLSGPTKSGAAPSEDQCECLGWMLERGVKLMAEEKRQRLREDWDHWANGDGPMPDEQPD